MVKLVDHTTPDYFNLVNCKFMSFISEYIVKKGKCYAVVISQCVTRRNGRRDCKEKGKAFKFDKEVDCHFCGNCK